MFSLFMPGRAIPTEDCGKARSYYERGKTLVNYEERRKAFQTAVDLCPSFAEAHVNLADAFENLAMMSKDLTQKNLAMNNKFLDMAIKQYQEALKIRTNLFVAHLGLAENYTRIGLYAKAQDSYPERLSRRP